jgi:hypothetical protein
VAPSQLTVPGWVALNRLTVGDGVIVAVDDQYSP